MDRKGVSITLQHTQDKLTRRSFSVDELVQIYFLRKENMSTGKIAHIIGNGARGGAVTQALTYIKDYWSPTKLSTRSRTRTSYKKAVQAIKVRMMNEARRKKPVEASKETELPTNNKAKEENLIPEVAAAIGKTSHFDTFETAFNTFQQALATFVEKEVETKSKAVAAERDELRLENKTLRQQVTDYQELSAKAPKGTNMIEFLRKKWQEPIKTN